MSEPIELSMIYPTPPSVENTEGEKYEDVKMARVDGSDPMVSAYLWENVSFGINMFCTCQTKSSPDQHSSGHSWPPIWPHPLIRTLSGPKGGVLKLKDVFLLCVTLYVEF